MHVGDMAGFGLSAAAAVTMAVAHATGVVATGDTAAVASSWLNVGAVGATCVALFWLHRDSITRFREQIDRIHNEAKTLIIQVQAEAKTERRELAADFRASLQDAIAAFRDDTREKRTEFIAAINQQHQRWQETVAELVGKKGA